MTDIRKAAEPPLRPCPFCGGRAEFERTGTPRQSCIVVCTDCGARHESSDEGERSGWSWNRGVRLAAEQPQRIACVCGEPWRLGTVHRAGGPCYVAEQPQPEAQGGGYIDPHNVARRARGIERVHEVMGEFVEQDGDGLICPKPPYSWETVAGIATSYLGWHLAGPNPAPPPSAPEPSEAEVAAAMASLYRAMEPAAWPSEDEITDALRAAAAARGK